MNSLEEGILGIVVLNVNYLSHFSVNMLSFVDTMGLMKVNQNTELFIPLYNDIQHNDKCVETSQLNISGRAPDPERMCPL